MLCCVVLCCVVLSCAVLCCVVLCCAVLCCQLNVNDNQHTSSSNSDSGYLY